jgi:hypothetical protein
MLIPYEGRLGLTRAFFFRQELHATAIIGRRVSDVLTRPWLTGPTCSLWSSADLAGSIFRCFMVLRPLTV